MVNMRLTNRKLRERGQRILTRSTGASPARAAKTLKAAAGNLPLALLMLHRRLRRDEAQRLLANGKSLASLLRGPS
jgi:N-acetylmuramic acid 6-phosphate etherase